MQAFQVRRGLFAASILAISGIAATGHADDAGVDAGADAGADAAVQQDASQGADASGMDATVTSTSDAEPASDAGEEPPAFDLLTSDASDIQDDGSLPAYSGTNIFALLCLQDPATTPSQAPLSYSSLLAPYPDQAGCMKYADQGHPAVHSCYCTSCFSLMQQCDAVAGCKEILKCELDNAAACSTATGCYFGPCGTVIDKWNNTSLSAFLPTLLQKCGAAATPTACPTN
jgi:hypothetical protein